MKNSVIAPFSLIIILMFMMTFFAGCEVVGDIFGAGVYTGMFIVIFVIVLIVILIARVMRKK